MTQRNPKLTPATRTMTTRTSYNRCEKQKKTGTPLNFFFALLWLLVGGTPLNDLFWHSFEWHSFDWHSFDRHSRIVTGSLSINWKILLEKISRRWSICLSYGCFAWSINTALDFLFPDDDFHTRSIVTEKSQFSCTTSLLFQHVELWECLVSINFLSHRSSRAWNPASHVLMKKCLK